MTDQSREVEVLGAAWCEDTARTLRCLRRLRVPHHVVDVDERIDGLELAMRLAGGRRRTPVVRVGDDVLVEPSNATLVSALEVRGLLAPSTVHAFEHGQNVGDLERWLRLVGAGVVFAAAGRLPAPLRVPIRVMAAGVAWTGAGGWCPIYDAQGVTSVGGPGDHPDEAERETWLASLRFHPMPQEPRS